ncbi:hypothetical protein DFP72DRAFT_1174985 [Ephemerocybe angulata]|uniref:Uncharacterized protein n=1 Tax=Ephemerocybe angulata TaxID=980116 RepID=A0A8H6M020_9AGAR|nr:hypothetical protein DFP72DRAFT_1174985 [Tulosesus angulatus]
MSPPPIVYSCPPELWTDIFNMTCLDGGYTARSLSQVSRQMRDVSFDHRYYSLKIESTSQLLKLEKNVEQGLVKKTKFLCVILPIDPKEEAYPSDASLHTKDPLECGSDDDYQPSEVDSDEESDTASSYSGFNSESSSVYEYKPLEDPEVQEVLSEIEEYRKGPWVKVRDSMAFTSLSDIENCRFPVFEFQHRVYTGPFEDSWRHAQQPFRLAHLTITMQDYSFWPPPFDDEPPVSLNFPSLLSLRLLGTIGFPTAWTKDLLDALPKSHSVNILSEEIRSSGSYSWPKAWVIGLGHVWEKYTPDKRVTPGETISQWLEDITGEAPPAHEVLVQKVERKDKMFYYEDCVRFSIMGTLFRVPRRPFIQGSARFEDLYGISAQDDTADGTVDLQGVTPEDFRVFCRLLLLPSHDPLSSTSFKKDDWLKVLELATGWCFRQIRTLAISHLESTLSAIELITAGRRVYHPRWVLSGYLDLVKRTEGLSHQEGDHIGQRTRACLMRIRRKLERERGRERCGDLEEFLRGEIRSSFVIEITRLEDHEKDLL